MATATAQNATPIVHAIRNEVEFDSAVADLDFLAEADPQEGTAAYDRMELLTILIAAYEDDHLPPFEAASPQEIVQFMAEQRGMTNAALAELIGGRPRLSEFLGGARELSKGQMIKLRDALGIPVDLLLSR
ncbi:MAG: helix-turn-helix domain-containing protein [Gemmatimonadales bacterium]